MWVLMVIASVILSVEGNNARVNELTSATEWLRAAQAEETLARSQWQDMIVSTLLGENPDAANVYKPTMRSVLRPKPNTGLHQPITRKLFGGTGSTPGLRLTSHQIESESGNLTISSNSILSISANTTKFSGSIFVDDIIVAGLSFATWLALAQEPCPAYSTGASVATGCTCWTAGSVSIIGVEPFYSSTCDCFVSNWTLDDPDDLSITLPLQSNEPTVYDFVVEWGDGEMTTVISDTLSTPISHSYAAVGTYTLIISGVLKGFAFRNGGDNTKIVNIMQWGTKFSFGNWNGYFFGCTNLQISAIDSPDLSGTPELYQMFRDASSFNSDISGWDVSSVTHLGTMFDGATVFNCDLSLWDTSKVRTMDNMFRDAAAFTSDLSGWDVTTATNMHQMFIRASAFTSDLSLWDTSKVRTMENMFRDADAFTSDLSGWNVSIVTECAGFGTNSLLAGDSFPGFECETSP